MSVFILGHIAHTRHRTSILYIVYKFLLKQTEFGGRVINRQISFSALYCISVIRTRLRVL